MRKTTAQLTIMIDAVCPHCEESIGLINDTRHEASDLIEQVCTEDWGRAKKEFRATETDCPECGETFDVEGFEF